MDSFLDRLPDVVGLGSDDDFFISPSQSTTEPMMFSFEESRNDPLTVNIALSPFAMITRSAILHILWPNESFKHPPTILEFVLLLYDAYPCDGDTYRCRAVRQCFDPGSPLFNLQNESRISC